MVQSPSKIEQALATMKDHGLKYTKKREAMISFLIKRNRYLSAFQLFVTVTL